MRTNRSSTLMKKGRLVAALGRRYNFFPARRHCIFRKEALLLERRRDLVERPLRLVFVYGVHEVVEVVEFIVLVLFAFSSKNLDGRDL